MLTNLTILVTRPEPQCSELCRVIDSMGGRAIAFPTIAFAPPPDMQAFHAAIQQLGNYSWLIFISPQAVVASVPAIRQTWSTLPPTVQFAAIGAGTAKALVAAGYQAAIQPDTDWSSEGLLAMPMFQQVRDMPIAVVRGVGGREMIDRELRARGADVLPVIAYQRIVPDSDLSPCLNELQAKQIDMIVCTSFESVNNLKNRLGVTAWPLLEKIPLIVMSERVKLLAEALGFRTIWVTRGASAAAIVDLIVERRNAL